MVAIWNNKTTRSHERVVVFCEVSYTIKCNTL